MPPMPPGPRLPPPLTRTTEILVSQITLPPAPWISYAEYVATDDHDHQQHKTLELARQRIVNTSRQNSRGILHSLLPIVCIGKEDAVLWVFAIGGRDHGYDQPCGGKGKCRADLTAVDELEAFSFDGLQRRHLSRFTPSTLYPCSSECANLPTTCSSCSRITPDPTPPRPLESSPSTILPRVPLRHIYAIFVDAIRDRLIDDICAIPLNSPELKAATVDPQTFRPSPRATRLGNGFLSVGYNVSPIWGAGWEHLSRKRPLVHTALHVSLSQSAIHIRPLPALTSLVPLPVSQLSPPSKPPSSKPALCTPLLLLTPGLPLVLAPYQTPAFYMSTHQGGSIPASLLSQFWDAMTGLGAYSLPVPRGVSPRSASSSPNSKSPAPGGPTNLTQQPFILVFIPIMNPQGEPKGLSALWPAHLVFIDTNPSRSHLTNFPEMPGTEALLTPPRGSGSQPIVQPSSPVVTSRVHRRHFRLRPSHRASRAQRTFRVFELSSHKRMPGMPVLAMAKQAAGYVEGVAREREKERERANQERVRRERDIKEGKSSGPGPPVPTTASTDTPQVSQPTAGVPTAGPSKPSPVLTRTTSSSSVLTTFFVKAAQGAEANSFYPSPPDWDPVASTAGPGPGELSALVPNLSTGSHTAGDVNSPPTSRSQPRSNVASQAIGGMLDLGNDMDLAMDIDNTMNMGINLSENMGFDMAVDMDATGIMDGTFGSFTDDDFNYFDTAPAGLPISAAHMRGSIHDLDTEEGAVDGWLTNGLQQGNADSIDELQHNASVLQGGTPTSMEADTIDHHAPIPPCMNGTQTEDDRDLLASAPDLIPSSPAKSPWSPGNPRTPSLEFNATPALPSDKGMFEPIAFGKSHWAADGKYRNASGKFTFPQQSPYSPQPVFVPGSPSSLNSDKDDEWKLRYDAATDPRVGVVMRLRGVKRKLQQTTFHGKVRGLTRDEEWASLYGRNEDTDLTDSSSSESENDVEEPEHGQDRDDASCLSQNSRPSTPLPPELPLMATLLYAHFHHAHLLPMGVPMRSSYGDIVSPTDPPPAPISVPTPVSPAAALGNASERNKTLEILAQAVAKEAVENDVWAEAWAISSSASSEEDSATVERRVSQTDVRQITELLSKVPGLRGTSTLSEFLDIPSPSAAQTISNQEDNLQVMHPPWLSIGRAGLVQHMLPPAIRFWEKEGLGPRGGTKDVVAFVLFEEGEERSTLVEKWLESVSRAYNARGLGNHISGNAGIYERGLVPVQFEAMRKTLPNLILALPSEPPHIVLYVVAPPSLSSSLKSPALRSIIMSQKRVPKLGGQHDFDQDRIIVHFVPEYVVTDPHMYPKTRHGGLERFVTLVYDRLLRPTLRQTCRQFWECNPPFENRFQVPAYVLARKTPPQTHLEWDEWPSRNVMDRHTFLQVGYRVSACRKWLVAACIDERGEAHDVAVWSIPDAPAVNVNWVVSNIWIFVKQFAQRADTEWRIVLAKLGEMGGDEVEEWMSHLETVASAYPGQTVHVSLVCAQNDIPLLFIPSPEATNNRSVNVATNSTGVFTDVSSTTYGAFLPQRMPIISPDVYCPTNHGSFVTPAVPEDETEQPPPKYPIGVLPLCTTALFRVPNETDLTTVSTLYIHLLHTYKSAKSTLKRSTHEVHMDITRNWYELAILTRERWHIPDHEELPFHLAALQVMSNVLSPLASAPDMPVKDADFLGG